MAAREPLTARLEAAKAEAVPRPAPEPLQTPGGLRRAWEAGEITSEQMHDVLVRVLTDGVIVSGADGRGRWAKVEDRVSFGSGQT
jgi:hypothetical protein